MGFRVWGPLSRSRTLEPSEGFFESVTEGFRVEVFMSSGLGFLGFRLQGSGFRVQGLGFRVLVQGSKGLRFKESGVQPFTD